MTLEAWVYPTAVSRRSGVTSIYKGDDNYYLMASTTASLATRRRAARSAAPAARSPAPAQSRREHVDAPGGDVRRRDAAAVRQRDAGGEQGADRDIIATSTNPLQIGGDTIYGQYFAGRIDEVRVYRAALSQAEIQADMAAPLGGPPDTSVPSQVSGLAASAVSSSRVDLSWSAASDNVGVTGYEVERCQGAGCSSFAAVTTVTTLAWSDTGRSPGTSYSYRVRARDAAGNTGRVFGCGDGGDAGGGGQSAVGAVGVGGVGVGVESGESVVDGGDG